MTPRWVISRITDFALGQLLGAKSAADRETRQSSILWKLRLFMLKEAATPTLQVRLSPLVASGLPSCSTAGETT